MTDLQSTQRIVPCLWLDDQAQEAAEFYTAIFENSKITNTSRYGEAGQEAHGRTPGTVMTVEFELDGHAFSALNGGPQFEINPSISFFVSCTTKREVDDLWERLAAGGSVLMPLQEYPFSDRYGWVQDKYGVSWQVMLVDEADMRQKITPSLMFVGERAGQAEAAMNFYASVFHDSAVHHIARYEEGEGVDEEGNVKHAHFTLDGQQFAAMDSSHEHQFAFNEAVSLQVMCEDQNEVDHFWETLSEGGDENARQCGWLEDKYGVSWQVVPRALGEMLNDPDPERAGRVFEAMLQMKKIDIAELKRAYAG